MAKSKFEDVVNAILQRVDYLEKRIDDISQRVVKIHEDFEALKASLNHFEQQEPEQPKASSFIWR